MRSITHRVRRRASALTGHLAAARRWSRAGRLVFSAALLAKPLTARRSGGYPGRSCSLIKSAFKVLRTQIARPWAPAGSIVIAFDVGEGLGSRLLQVSKRAVLEQFRLVARKQAPGVCGVV